MQLESKFLRLRTPVELGSEFGALTRAMTWIIPRRVALWTNRREQKRLAEGKTYEPKSVVEHCNWAGA